MLFTIANLPATANTLRHRLPTILLALPLRYIVSISNFAVPYLFKTLQRYKYVRKLASISAKIFVFLTFVFFQGYIYTNFKHKNGKVCKCWVQMYKDSVCITLNIDLYGCKRAVYMRTLYNSVYLPVAYLCNRYLVYHIPG